MAAAIMSCNENKTPENQALIYPKTKKVDTVDTYFGVKISDPYRWLENDTSLETAEWVKAQNKITFDYLDKISFRAKIKERLTKIWDYPKQTAPFKQSNHYFFYRNNGLQNQSVLYVTDDLKKDARILLDPNTLSKDGTTALANMSISKDGKYLSYSVAHGGSDWNEIYVKEIATGKDLPDHIEWVKFSGISWFGDGFFYGGYDAPIKGKELSNRNEYHKLFYHKLGTSQSEDKLIMSDKKSPLKSFFADVTDDEKYLIVYEENVNTVGLAFYVKDLTKKNATFIKVVSNYENQYSVLDCVDDKLLVRTNYKAPKYKLISIDLKNLYPEKWIDIIPEQENVLESVALAGDKIVATYMKDAYSQLEIFDTNGKSQGAIKLSGIGTVPSFNSDKGDNEAFYTFTSFTTPGDIYKYNVSTGKSEIYQTSKIDFDGSKYETKQVFYESKDGEKIPMFIVHKKGINLDGNNPALLYGYGGFNVSLTPSFSISNIIWLENGGVYALANLRGGGEYGEKWHEAGTKLNKQNVFNDFIAAAEYLIKQKYTNSQKLVLRGGSNGGLLVGAVINQRPDLCKVALPAVGVMDMLRYQKFTIGWNWVSDYGASDDSIQFNNLIKFSPLHNIQENIEYPAVLVTTADHDDRVVPAHSFKYIATLQEKYKGENPVVVRIETMAGHSAGKPTSKAIDEYTDMWSFVYQNLGITPNY